MEIRGIWLTNTDSQVLTSKDKITEAMEFLAETGFNVVFPVVWNQGYTLYPSQIMQEAFGYKILPKFQDRDPLGELCEAAKKVGLAVIPWFEYGFACSYRQKGGKILQAKPHWAARDRDGNLLSKNGFEWMNAFDIEVQHFLSSLVLEVAKNYPIDGIQGDDRMPALPSAGGYDQNTIQAYRQVFDCDPPDNPYDARWIQWRADILTNFLSRLYQNLKQVNPNLIVSLSPNIYKWCLDEYLQDSKTWLNRNLVDLIHPQVYRRDLASYKRTISYITKLEYKSAHLPRLSPGILIKIGNYRISESDLIEAIAFNRYCGVSGEVLFFYEGLRENNNALAKALGSGPYLHPAQFPSINDLEKLVQQKQSQSIFSKVINHMKDLI